MLASVGYSSDVGLQDEVVSTWLGHERFSIPPGQLLATTRSDLWRLPYRLRVGSYGGAPRLGQRGHAGEDAGSSQQARARSRLAEKPRVVPCRQGVFAPRRPDRGGSPAPTDQPEPNSVPRLPRRRCKRDPQRRDERWWQPRAGTPRSAPVNARGDVGQLFRQSQASQARVGDAPGRALTARGPERHSQVGPVSTARLFQIPR